jgi:integrase
MKNVPIEIHKEDYEGRVNSVDDWEIPENEKKELYRFLEELELGKVNRGRKISKTRQLKYLSLLKCPLEYFGENVEKLNQKDIESFEKSLSSGKIKNRFGKEYEHNTKVDIRIALKVYLKWRLKEKALLLVDWLDTRREGKTPDYLSEKDIEILYKQCKSNKERYLIAVLFDAGARAGEFFNIRFEDIKIPVEKESFIKITLKEEYSKTKGRVASLYWKNSLDAVRDFYEERKKEGIRTDEPLFKDTYDAARFFLMRLGKKVLKRSIHFHLFRHSSATYYANKLNRQELCYRYGWAFSSRMPDVYISRAGMENKELDEKFTQTELGELKTKLERQEQENKLMKERQERLEEDLTKRRELDPILNNLFKSKGAIELFEKLLRKADKYGKAELIVKMRNEKGDRSKNELSPTIAE